MRDVNSGTEEHITRKSDSDREEIGRYTACSPEVRTTVKDCVYIVSLTASHDLTVIYHGDGES